MKNANPDRTKPQISAPEPPTTLALRLRRWRVWLLVSTVTGTAVGLNGLVIAVAAVLEMVKRHGILSESGTVMIAASFPLMFLAAHCLDKMDETNKAIGREQYWGRRSSDRHREIAFMPE